MGTAIFLLSAGLLLWQSLFYPLTLMALGALRGKRRRTRLGYTPALTVIIPTHNEAGTIRRRLANLRDCEYPQEELQVIVVDSGSVDGTGEVVEAFVQEVGFPGLELIREPERRGKAAAINLALQKARGELVVVTDAPTLFASDALIRVAANFAEDSVGAATGTFQIEGQVTLAQHEEGLFWNLRNRLRLLEANVDSTPFLSGELCCFRRSLVPSLDEDALADDMNIPLQVRRAGYRAIVDTTVKFSEMRSTSFRELTTTKTTRAVSGLVELVRFRGMLLRPRYGLFGLLIMPSALLYYLPLRPLAVLVTLRALLSGARVRARRWRFPCLVGVALLGPLIYKWRREVMRLLTVALFNEWIFTRAFVAWLTGNYSVKWPQERSTREILERGDRKTR